jgi:hypothetical protein
LALQEKLMNVRTVMKTNETYTDCWCTRP